MLKDYMKNRVIAVLVALFAALVIAAPANASVDCGTPPAPRPPSSEAHCSYSYPDASSTYFHLGNAEDYLFAGFLYSASVGNASALAAYNYLGYSSGTRWWVGRTDYGRSGNTVVAPSINLYNPTTRRYCQWTALVQGTDTGTKSFVVAPYQIGSCTTY